MSRFTEGGPHLRINCVLPLSAASLAGVAVFGWGLLTGNSLRVWQAYHVNLIFWLGLCLGSVALVAIFNLTNAWWARPLKRLAEAPACALPVLWLAFWGLYFGRDALFPWARKPVHGKELWLSAASLFPRDGLTLAILVVLCLALVYQSVRDDREFLGFRGGNRGFKREPGRRWKAQKVLSFCLATGYGLGMTLLAWDLIMSLDPHWVSTLFGAYYFLGSIYTAVGALILLGIIFHRQEGFCGALGPRQFHDLGKLLMAFCLVTGDFFYSQFLVIWYGNIPEETKYVILRVKTMPWQAMAWIVMVMSFGVPFLALLSRKLKMVPALLGPVALLALLGMWLERMLLVAPSVWSEAFVPLGWVELGVSLGFLGMVGLATRWFLLRVPPLPISDPLFRERFPEAGEFSWGTLQGRSQGLTSSGGGHV
ncbi:MAG: hypothetical protein ACUVS3_00905 [Thermodesulfobacteriota bacterium]